MKLHDLQPAPGSKKKRIRVGRGIAAGRGKTAGYGTKGQTSRSGGSIPAWFEGGQTPIHRRIPKLRGFRNVLRVEVAVVNVGRIQQWIDAGRLKGAFTARFYLAQAGTEEDDRINDSARVQAFQQWKAAVKCGAVRDRAKQAFFEVIVLSIWPFVGPFSSRQRCDQRRLTCPHRSLAPRLPYAITLWDR